MAFGDSGFDAWGVDFRDVSFRGWIIVMKPIDATVSTAEPAAVEPQHVQRTSTPPVRFEPVHNPGWFRRLAERWEARISRLSVKNNFWHRVCSWVFLPLAYRSGIKFKKTKGEDFSVVLPFRRFNRNWYSAMAGAALLANSEVAGGMYVFGKCGGDYTVVCKHLDYKFLRPCLGPAQYQVRPHEPIEPMVATGREFNITLDLHVVQMVHAKDHKERRVGKCTATFHVTPKAHARARLKRQIHQLRPKGRG